MNGEILLLSHCLKNVTEETLKITEELVLLTHAIRCTPKSLI